MTKDPIDVAISKAAGYYYQDWATEWDTFDDALRAYLYDASLNRPDNLEGLRRALLLPAAELELLVSGWGISVEPRMGGTAREFLSRLLRALELHGG